MKIEGENNYTQSGVYINKKRYAGEHGLLNSSIIVL